jgi:hypothetical protein
MTSHQRTPTLSIVPVVELDPGQYRNADHPYPNVSRIEDPAGWQAYWSRCMADAGIENLEALPNTDFVEVARLTDPEHLRAICTAELSGLDFDADLDEQLGPLDGGLAFLIDGVPRLVPQCCGDLGAWREWRTAASDPPDDWSMMWIGHPWISVRRRSTGLELSQLHEDDAEPTANLSVDLELLQVALGSVEDALNAFALRLEAVLAERLDQPRARRTAHILSGLREHQTKTASETHE